MRWNECRRSATRSSDQAPSFAVSAGTFPIARVNTARLPQFRRTGKARPWGRRVVIGRRLADEPTDERLALTATVRPAAYQVQREVRPRAIPTFAPPEAQQLAWREQRNTMATAALRFDRAALPANVV